MRLIKTVIVYPVNINGIKNREEFVIVRSLILEIIQKSNYGLQTFSIPIAFTKLLGLSRRPRRMKHTRIINAKNGPI